MFAGTISYVIAALYRKQPVAALVVAVTDGTPQEGDRIGVAGRMRGIVAAIPYTPQSDLIEWENGQLYALVLDQDEDLFDRLEALRGHPIGAGDVH